MPVKVMPRDYEILSAEKVAQLHAAFQERLRKEADRLLPKDADENLRAVMLKLVAAEALYRVHIDRDRLKKMDAESLQIRILTMRDIKDFSRDEKEDIRQGVERRKEAEGVKELFGGSDRIYLKFDQKQDAVSLTARKVEKYLWRKKNLLVVDYRKGLAVDGTRTGPLKFGKFLEDKPALHKDFMEDDTRVTDGMMIVISKNPVDLARMSTNRGWKSCMASGEGCRWPMVVEEIAKGGLIAYLVSEKDPDITRPFARCLLRPYLQAAAPKKDAGPFYSLTRIFKKAKAAVDAAVFFMTGPAYGLANKAFTEAVNTFAADKLNAGKNGTFLLDPDVFPDIMPAKIKVADGRAQKNPQGVQRVKYSFFQE